MSPVTETGFEDAETEVLRNLWLAKWGSEPVPYRDLYWGIGGLEAELDNREQFVLNNDNNIWTLKPNANN